MANFDEDIKRITDEILSDVLLPGRKPAETVVWKLCLFPALYAAGTIERKSRCIPGTDPGYPDHVPVRFVRYHGLYVLRPPEVKTLLLAAALLPGKIQVFHDDAVHIIFDRCIYDELCGLDRNVVVDAFRLFPESWSPPGA